VFIVKASGIPKWQDDDQNIGIFGEKELPEILAFDHLQILKDYFHVRSKYPNWTP
jgi:8-oxo-dGTP diphosphatase